MLVARRSIARFPGDGSGQGTAAETLTGARRPSFWQRVQGRPAAGHGPVCHRCIPSNHAPRKRQKSSSCRYIIRKAQDAGLALRALVPPGAIPAPVLRLSFLIPVAHGRWHEVPASSVDMHPALLRPAHRRAGAPTDGTFRRYAPAASRCAGTTATMRSGPPLPPRIFIGNAMTSKPAVGRRSRLAMFSSTGMLAANKAWWASKRVD